MEHIIHSSIMKHFDANNILSDAQHGFRYKRSCKSQLVITVQEIAKRLAKGSQVDIILLDFAKAFDTTLMTVHLLGLKLICHLFSQFSSWLSIVPFMARNKSCF
jgi:hypothetical protein